MHIPVAPDFNFFNGHLINIPNASTQVTEARL